MPRLLYDPCDPRTPNVLPAMTQVELTGHGHYPHGPNTTGVASKQAELLRGSNPKPTAYLYVAIPVCPSALGLYSFPQAIWF